MCGKNKPDTVVSSGNQMLVVFTSDYMIQDKGFRAEVKFSRQSFEGVHVKKVTESTSRYQ